METAALPAPRSPSYPCPCCGYVSFYAPPGSDGICTICMWWDDLEQLRRPTMRGGANGPSLVDAQVNFRTFGAAELTLRTYARSPRPEDRRDPDWRAFDLASDDLEPSSAGSSEPTRLYYWRERIGRQTA